MHQTMLDYLRALEAEERHGTAASYELALRQFDGWLERSGLDPTRATTENLQAFQRWLAEEYRQANGAPLKKSTQQTRLNPVLAYYRWLERRGLVLSNPGKGVKLPKVPRRQTLKDYLDLQEATALIQAQAQRVMRWREGSFKWAEQHRNLALLCLAIATGRRRYSLVTLKVADLDLQRGELRVAWEKGKAGRVLPVAQWAITICRLYLEQARSRLLRRQPQDAGWLFPGTINDHVNPFAFCQVLQRVHHEAVEQNPDLEALAGKHLTPHCLRVTFATLLFRGGCNIRSVNELMLHASLSTTARYTPIPLEDLKRVCRLTHPRA